MHDELAVPLHDGLGVLERPQHRSGTHGVHGVRLEQKRGDDAEVPAASAKGPEQVAILVRAGDDHGPVREDDIG